MWQGFSYLLLQRALSNWLQDPAVLQYTFEQKSEITKDKLKESSQIC